MVIASTANNKQKIQKRRKRNEKEALIVMLTLIVSIVSAFALSGFGETNDNGNGDNTDNTTVVTPGGGNKDTDDGNNPEKPATEGLKYTLLVDDTYEVTGYDGTATEINIPSTYNGKPVKSIRDNAINSERDFRKAQQKTPNNIENSLQMIA